jgi:hypothetical protein
VRTSIYNAVADLSVSGGVGCKSICEYLKERR